MIELCTMVIIHTVDADLEILMSVPLHLLFLYGVSDLVLVSISAWSSFFRAPFNEVLVLESPIFLIWKYYFTHWKVFVLLRTFSDIIPLTSELWFCWWEVGYQANCFFLFFFVKVICLVFLAPVKLSLCIWSLKLYYDVFVVYFKCYATWILLIFLNMWNLCLSHFEFSVIISLNTAFSLLSLLPSPETLIRYMWERLSLFSSVSFMLSGPCGCLFLFFFF